VVEFAKGHGVETGVLASRGAAAVPCMQGLPGCVLAGGERRHPMRRIMSTVDFE
jgi:hypothetical protein